MTCRASHRRSAIRGFTLVELLTALLVLSLLALMSYRGLSSVLDTREHVSGEAAKWHALAAFFERFEHDVQLAMPRPVRTLDGDAPAFVARDGSLHGPRLEFSRAGAGDVPRRVGYGYNGSSEIELWLWPGLDAAGSAPAVRHSVLKGVSLLEIDVLDERLAWTRAWPVARTAAALPRAVRLRIVLASGEEIVRVYALRS